jgi:hypothetical protein
MTSKEKQALARLRAIQHRGENGQFAVAMLLREKKTEIEASGNVEYAPPVLKSVVPSGLLRRMAHGQWQQSIEMIGCSKPYETKVAGFELGEVQLRLVFPLLGPELRSALESMSPGEPLRLQMKADDESAHMELDVNLGPDGARYLAELVQDCDEDSATTLSMLIALAHEVASLSMGHPNGRIKPPYSPDVLVITVIPTSLVRATAELIERDQETTH